MQHGNKYHIVQWISKYYSAKNAEQYFKLYTTGDVRWLWLQRTILHIFLNGKVVDEWKLGGIWICMSFGAYLIDCYILSNDVLIIGTGRLDQAMCFTYSITAYTNKQHCSSEVLNFVRSFDIKLCLLHLSPMPSLIVGLFNCSNPWISNELLIDNSNVQGVYINRWEQKATNRKGFIRFACLSMQTTRR